VWEQINAWQHLRFFPMRSPWRVRRHPAGRQLVRFGQAGLTGTPASLLLGKKKKVNSNALCSVADLDHFDTLRVLLTKYVSLTLSVTNPHTKYNVEQSVGWLKERNID
jgi:hypothetical protein